MEVDQDMLEDNEAGNDDMRGFDDEEFDEGYGDEEGTPQNSPSKANITLNNMKTPFRTPYKTPRKTPAKTPGRTPKTPRTVQKSTKKDKKKKKKKARKSQLDISALTDEQVALAALQSNQILHLKLRRKYYAEGLNFIRQIEGAMEIIGQLLGSTNKAEVLESMEFFRVAHEYQFESAQVSCFVAFMNNLLI